MNNGSNVDIIADSLDLVPFKDDEYLPVSHSKATVAENSNLDDDLKYVRQNLYDLIEKGHRSVDELLNVADQSQHPRAYEVLANMLKTMGDMNKDLIDMHKKKKELTGEAPIGPETVNNNLYVGSTSDLLKIINKSDE